MNRVRNQNLSVLVVSIPNQISQESKNKSGFGTGFVFWRSGYVLTAGHLLNTETPSEIFVVTTNSWTLRYHQAQILAYDEELDVMAIKIPYNFGLEIPLENSDRVNLWEKVYSYGCPLAACGTYTEGNFFAHGNFTNQYQLYNYDLFDMPVLPGSSGQGVFNKSGNLISINVGYFEKQHRISNGPRSNAIREFLNDNELPYQEAIHFW